MDSDGSDGSAGKKRKSREQIPAEPGATEGWSYGEPKKKIDFFFFFFALALVSPKLDVGSGDPKCVAAAV